ncbi:MAG: hypothetical protein AAB484_01600 [Patescibacteria group bacterium]
MKYTSTIAFVIIIVALITSFVIISKRNSPNKPSSEAITSFAQCLASKKLTMYGAAWCSHCKKEKALFGDAFKYIPYVECPENEKLCLDKGVNGYPTWIDGAGVKYVGEQGLDGLAKISGCPLPN